VSQLGKDIVKKFETFGKNILLLSDKKSFEVKETSSEDILKSLFSII